MEHFYKWMGRWSNGSKPSSLVSEKGPQLWSNSGGIKHLCITETKVLSGYVPCMHRAIAQARKLMFWINYNLPIFRSENTQVISGYGFRKVMGAPVIIQLLRSSSYCFQHNGDGGSMRPKWSSSSFKRLHCRPGKDANANANPKWLVVSNIGLVWGNDC